MKLKDIAHSRTGDKGDIVNISLITYKAEDYKLIEEKVTKEVVKAWFSEIAESIDRYCLPKVNALNFVLKKSLGGGGQTSLHLDKLGRTLSSALLEMEI